MDEGSSLGAASRMSLSRAAMSLLRSSLNCSMYSAEVVTFKEPDIFMERQIITRDSRHARPVIQAKGPVSRPAQGPHR